MNIVDPHFHLWDLNQLGYPWLTTLPSVGVYGDNSPIRKTYTVTDYLLDASEFVLRKTVHIEAAVAPGSAVQETLWLNTESDRTGHPTAIVAYCDLSDPDVNALLDAHQQSKRLVGIRQILNTHTDPLLNFASEDYLDNSRWIEGFQKLSPRDLSFDIQIYPHQMKAAAAFANRHDATSIVLNHTGMPLGLDDDSIAAWRVGMTHLSACPNVSVKISGLGMMFHDWTEALIRPFVRETIELFGTDRCMFASNFPVDSMYSSFEFLWTAYQNIVSDLTIVDQEKLFGRTAERIYRI